tara:strand:- start:1056 stop:1253 length:198 start_codon:yes stop_codon:yes gene_type:complete
MKRFHFQVNTTVNYDVAEINANSLQEAEEQMRWYYAQHKGYENIVHIVKEEPNEDFNAFMGINAL